MLIQNSYFFNRAFIRNYFHSKIFNARLNFNRKNYFSTQNNRSCLNASSNHYNKDIKSSLFPSVGVVFDIDGVITRGRKIIKNAKESLEKLDLYNVPYIYLTNSGCETEKDKAKALEKYLEMTIDPDQIVLSHSPLRALFTLHNKHFLVCGQGPVSEIAEQCGFLKVSHVDDVDGQYPELCVVDKIKRENMPTPYGKPFRPFEGVILMGEPLNWEKSIQIIIDIVLCNGGAPDQKHPVLNKQIPVVAVNPDLIWMSESANPRFGHGAFLLCLESVFKKLTGKELEYSAVLGKPNLLTYLYSEEVLFKFAQKKYGSDKDLKTVYAIGDNPTTDIYGANVYHKYLKTLQLSRLDDPLEKEWNSRLEQMKSILVKTGVYSTEDIEDDVNHLHRDTPFHPQLSKPTHTCDDVYEAVKTILKEEGLC